MSTGTKRPAPGTPNTSTRPPTSENPTSSSNSTTITPRGSSKSSGGLQRTPSNRGPPPVSARAAVRKPGRSNLSVTSVPQMLNNEASDEDARAANIALIDDLKEQLQKAETASEHYQKQLDVLQMRLDEAISEQGNLEDQSHEKENKIEALNAQIQNYARRHRDLEIAHEQERNAMLQDKAQQASREEELQATIQRLKETITQKDLRVGADPDRNISRSSSFRNRSSADLNSDQFVPSTQMERSPSRNNSQLLLQKDKLIESLRLELAESQIKLVEMENRGGGRQQELERELLEARMANARLMEDNESYQLLLSEKTLNGDFSKADFLHESLPRSSYGTGGGAGSLADELESAGESSTNEDSRKLEAEIRALKDQNKALTLYIERIIGRLLQHDGFEHILDQNDKPAPPKPEKDLPPPPPEKDNQPASFLERAKSVVTGQANRPQAIARPTSFMPPTSHPTPHENPDTAPSIPLGRSQSIRAAHRRTRSDQASEGTAASVVGQMYRGPSGSRSPSGGQISPLMTPTTIGPGSRQSGFFNSSFSGLNATGRDPSLSSNQRPGSADSLSSDPNADVSSRGGASTPPSRTSSGMNNYPGAVMTQSKLRPLRLVREQEIEGGIAPEDEAAQKRANRASWMGWFNRGKEDGS